MTPRQENMVWWIGSGIINAVWAAATHSLLSSVVAVLAYVLASICLLRSDR